MAESKSSALSTGQHITDLERRLTIPSGFLTSLRDEDDWSFVIKGHAFIEAALTEFLATASDRRLGDLYQGMPVGGRHGKLQFALALELLSKEGFRFVSALSRVRNRFAHDVRSTGLTFLEFFGRFDTAALKPLVDDLIAPFHGVSITHDKGYGYFVRSAKDVIYYGALIVLAEIYFAVHPHEDEAGRSVREYAVAFWKGIGAVAATMVADQVSPNAVSE